MSREAKRSDPRASGEPIFREEPVDTAELSEISRNDRETPTSRMTRDQKIVAADRQALALEHCANVRGMRGGSLVEGQDVHSLCETHDFTTILDRSRRFLGAMQEFGQHYRRDAKRVGFSVKPLPQALGPIAQEPNAKIRVEHITQHV
jgi:hypothetical protein